MSLGGRTARPAAAICRRSLRLGPLLAASLAACGCAPAPSVENADAFARNLRRNTRTVRSVDAKKAVYLEDLVALAEQATFEEAALPSWRRSPGRSEAAWLRAAEAAVEAVRDVRSRQHAAKEKYEALLGRVRRQVDAARTNSTEAGMGRHQGRSMAIANTEFATAQRLAAADLFVEASVRLERAEEAAKSVTAAWQEVHRRFSDRRLLREWRRWVEATIEESRDTRSAAIIIDKLDRSLNLYYSGLLLVSYPVELGTNGLQRKLFAGDRATPEGMYRVVKLKEGRETKYHKALLLDYPNEDDQARFDRARQRGEIPRGRGIGSMIEIHGGGGDGGDWTDGCIALANQDIDMVYARAHVGTLVTIVGTYGH
jgi:hypothetical protein